jgi:hypothetical protein
MTRLTHITLILVAISTNYPASSAGDWRARTVGSQASTEPTRSSPVESVVVRDHSAVASGAPCRVTNPDRANDAKIQHSAQSASKNVATPQLGCHPVRPTMARAGQAEPTLTQPDSHADINSLALPASHPVKQVKFTGDKVPVARTQTAWSKADPISPQSVFPTVPNISPADFDRSDAIAGKTYMDELGGLVPNTPKKTAAAANGDYLTDLSSLLHGPSSWVLVRGAGLDLRPEEPEPVGSSASYLNDLQSLVSDSAPQSAANPRDRRAAMLSAYRSIPAHNTQTTPQAVAPPRETYVIPATPPCDIAGGDSVANMFQAVNSISVTGHSTAPPTVPKQATKMELDLPANQACAFRQYDVPNYYLNNGYGIQRAPRNTHAFRNNPLYFEDANLERCGISNGCLTTATSAVQFTAITALLPYLTTATHPRECVQALPDCPTCGSFGTDAYFPEWSWKGAVVQAAAVTGLVYIIP